MSHVCSTAQNSKAAPTPGVCVIAAPPDVPVGCVGRSTPSQPGRIRSGHMPLPTDRRGFADFQQHASSNQVSNNQLDVPSILHNGAMHVPAGVGVMVRQCLALAALNECPWLRSMQTCSWISRLQRVPFKVMRREIVFEIYPRNVKEPRWLQQARSHFNATLIAAANLRRQALLMSLHSRCATRQESWCEARKCFPNTEVPCSVYCLPQVCSAVLAASSGWQ
jgi:hypothetical protein